MRWIFLWTLHPSHVCGIGQSARLLHPARYCLQSYKQIGQSEILQPFHPVWLHLQQVVHRGEFWEFFGKYEKEKKLTSSGSSDGGCNSSVTISTQKEEIYESKDFASLDPGEFIGMGNRFNIKGHFRKKFRLFELEEELLPVRKYLTIMPEYWEISRGALEWKRQRRI